MIFHTCTISPQSMASAPATVAMAPDLGSTVHREFGSFEPAPVMPHTFLLAGASTSCGSANEHG